MSLCKSKSEQKKISEVGITSKNLENRTQLFCCFFIDNFNETHKNSDLNMESKFLSFFNETENPEDNHYINYTDSDKFYAYNDEYRIQTFCI